MHEQMYNRGPGGDMSRGSRRGLGPTLHPIPRGLRLCPGHGCGGLLTGGKC